MFDVLTVKLNDISPLVHSTHGQHCWIGGWGTVRSGSQYSNKLKESGVNVMSSEYCLLNSQLSLSYLRPEVEFCAGTPDRDSNGLTDGGTDTCQGDSGGPLICANGQQPVLYGITSWGFGCGVEGYPGVYTKVAPVTPWIQKMMKVHSRTLVQTKKPYPILHHLGNILNTLYRFFNIANWIK